MLLPIRSRAWAGYVSVCRHFPHTWICGVRRLFSFGGKPHATPLPGGKPPFSAFGAWGFLSCQFACGSARHCGNVRDTATSGSWEVKHAKQGNVEERTTGTVSFITHQLFVFTDNTDSLRKDAVRERSRLVKEHMSTTCSCTSLFGDRVWILWRNKCTHQPPLCCLSMTDPEALAATEMNDEDVGVWAQNGTHSKGNSRRDGAGTAQNEKGPIDPGPGCNTLPLSVLGEENQDAASLGESRPGRIRTSNQQIMSLLL